MFTSVLDYDRAAARRAAKVYLLITVFTALFGGVYELFSFGVFSPFMAFAFAVPLLLGALPALAAAHGDRSIVVSRPGRSFWHAGVAALTVGCVFRGILDIYGTASALGNVYWVAGGALLAASVALDLTIHTQE